ncbi:MAG TPA: efflux RND transporter periplasmic adaptor subunit [bacterium]|nr:efflux RND transporter periplasmic adaptor subunit [bacterium]
MLKIFRKKFVIIGLIILIIIIGLVYRAKKSGQTITYTTAKVEIMTLKQTVDVTGQVASAQAINLNFKTTGRIKEILVKAGDKVVANQKLASLDTGALASQITNAEAAVRQAQADYEKIKAGATAEDIKVYEDRVVQKEQELLNAESNLNTTKSKGAVEINNLKDALITTLKNELVTAQAALEEIDNSLNDTDAQGTLSIKNKELLNIAETNKIVAQTAYEEIKNTINTLELTVGTEDLKIISDNLKNVLNKIATALADTLDVLGATTTSADLSETELDALKTNIKTRQTAINTANSTLQSAKASWLNKISYYEDLIASAENSVASAQKALTIAEAELLLKKKPAQSYDIKSAEARVAQASASLALARANFNDAIIVAPVDGTITKKNFSVGEQSLLTTPVLEMIGKTNLEIKVDIPESDIAKVQVGQEVEITLDAFGPDQKFMGQVVFVDPAETEIQDVVYYKVTVQFNDQTAIGVKPGMTANVTICTAKKDQVLVVPGRAVKSQNGDKYVTVLVDAKKNITADKTVIIGLKGNEGIEIISGLQAGEEVITFVKN